MTGPPGYEEFLEAIADPDGKRRREMREWCGEDFDPHAVDVADISLALTDVGKSRHRKTKSKAQRTSR